MWSMTIMVERLYLTHFNRGEEFCPLCYASIIWRKVGERKYCPCDKLPVLCRFDKSSRMRVVKNGEILSGVTILTPGNAPQFVGARIFPALQPHVFTCSELEKYRRNYKDAESRCADGPPDRRPRA